MADEPSEKPTRITGRKFLQALIDAEVFRPYDYVRRVVIDASIGDALRLYVERVGDERALPVASMIPDLIAEAAGEEPTGRPEVYVAGMTGHESGAPALGDPGRKDLDETRRLLYMSLVASRTKRYNLAGTLANAIKHHQGLDIDTNELLDHVVDAVEGGNTAWVRDQIDRINHELGD